MVVIDLGAFKRLLKILLLKKKNVKKL